MFKRRKRAEGGLFTKRNLLSGASRNRRNKGSNIQLPDTGFVALVGPTGSGKSALCTKFAHSFVGQKCEGKACGKKDCQETYTVYSNDMSQVAAGWAEDFADIIPVIISGMPADHIVLVLDEAHLISDNRSPMSKANRVFNSFARQIRKYRCLCFLTTPSIDGIDTVIRNLLKMSINCWNPDKHAIEVNGWVRVLSLGHLDPVVRKRMRDKRGKWNCKDTRDLYKTHEIMQKSVIDIGAREIYLDMSGTPEIFTYEQIVQMAVGDVMQAGKGVATTQDVEDAVRARFPSLQGDNPEPAKFSKQLHAICGAMLTLNTAIVATGKKPEEWELGGSQKRAQNQAQHAAEEAKEMGVVPTCMWIWNDKGEEEDGLCFEPIVDGDKRKRYCAKHLKQAEARRQAESRERSRRNREAKAKKKEKAVA